MCQFCHPKEKTESATDPVLHRSTPSAFKYSCNGRMTTEILNSKIMTVRLMQVVIASKGAPDDELSGTSNQGCGVDEF